MKWQKQYDEYYDRGYYEGLKWYPHQPALTFAQGKGELELLMEQAFYNYIEASLASRSLTNVFHFRRGRIDQIAFPYELKLKRTCFTLENIKKLMSLLAICKDQCAFCGLAVYFKNLEDRTLVALSI